MSCVFDDPIHARGGCIFADPAVFETGGQSTTARDAHWYRLVREDEEILAVIMAATVRDRIRGITE